MNAVAETALPDSAIDSIAELQKRATHIEPFTVDREPSDVYFLRKPDGTVERRVAESKPLNDKLATPNELAAYVRDLSGRGRAPTEGIAIIYPDAAVYRFEFADGRHQARVPLVKTAAFKAIEQLAGANYQGALLMQPDVYRLLRVTLRGCLSSDSLLAQVIREVKFDNNTAVSGTIDQSRKNLGLAITGRVAGANDQQIPESFAATLSVFENFNYPVTIEIDLDTVPEQLKFRLTPYPGQIERAMQHTLAAIRNVFDSSAVDTNAASVCPAYIAQ